MHYHFCLLCSSLSLYYFMPFSFFLYICMCGLCFVYTGNTKCVQEALLLDDLVWKAFIGCEITLHGSEMIK